MSIKPENFARLQEIAADVSKKRLKNLPEAQGAVHICDIVSAMEADSQGSSRRNQNKVRRAAEILDTAQFDKATGPDGTTTQTQHGWLSSYAAEKLEEARNLLNGTGVAAR